MSLKPQKRGSAPSHLCVSSKHIYTPGSFSRCGRETFMHQGTCATALTGQDRTQTRFTNPAVHNSAQKEKESTRIQLYNELVEQSPSGRRYSTSPPTLKALSASTHSNEQPFDAQAGRFTCTAFRSTLELAPSRINRTPAFMHSYTTGRTQSKCLDQEGNQRSAIRDHGRLKTFVEQS
jgi:hypothetical protein